MNMNGLIIRNVLFPLMESFKGNKIRKNLSYLQKTQALAPSELKALQEKKLKNLLLHCVEKVPAYQEFRHLVPLIKENPFAALERFPVLTKQQFNAVRDRYISEGIDKSVLIPNKTGGSTGEPVKFSLDRETVEYYEAARWRGLSWWDIKIGDSSVMFWGSPIELSQQQKLKFRIKERWLKNRYIIPAYDLNPDSVAGHVEKLNRFKPEYIYGYASVLHLFSGLMAKQNLTLDFIPKGVVSTSETLYDFQRTEIEKAFRCKTVNEYGARDGGIIAYQCPKGEMHITAENAWIEIADVNTKLPLQPGTSGLVLVTDLNNYVMPRLRYQVGDIASISPEPCTCGLSLPVMDKIQGREDDMFLSLNGTYIHGHYFNHLARNMHSIKQFQVIQHSRDRMSAKIIRSDSCDESEIRHFREEILKAMGPVELDIEFVDSIPLSASGKLRYAVREFPL